jgi:hypothetical protein
MFAAALIVAASGCPQTGAPTGPTETKLLEKYKEEGKSPKATILYFTSGISSRDAQRAKEFLQGIENLSDGTVNFVAVNGEFDREGKKAYGVSTYPTVVFFNEAGDLKEIHGLGLDMETAKKIVTEYGATVREPGEEETPEEGGEEPLDEEGEETPEKGAEEVPEKGGE